MPRSIEFLGKLLSGFVLFSPRFNIKASRQQHKRYRFRYTHTHTHRVRLTERYMSSHAPLGARPTRSSTLLVFGILASNQKHKNTKIKTKQGKTEAKLKLYVTKTLHTSTVACQIPFKVLELTKEHYIEWGVGCLLQCNSSKAYQNLATISSHLSKRISASVLR